MTDELTSRERKQVARLSRGNELIESIAIASLQLRKLGTDIPREYRYRSYEEFFLKHGRLYRPQPFPPKYRKWRGKPQACLYNALELALSCPELEYVEGYALHMDASIPVPMDHSWCVDADGNVVDPTWYKTVGRDYFGLALDKWLLTERHEKGEPFGLMFNEELFLDVASGKQDWRKWLARGSDASARSGDCNRDPPMTTNKWKARPMKRRKPRKTKPTEDDITITCQHEAADAVIPRAGYPPA